MSGRTENANFFGRMGAELSENRLKIEWKTLATA